MSQNNPLTALLENQPFVVLDGAMATELEARGCNLADSLWSAKVLMENPELIRDVHLDYTARGHRWRSPPAIRPRLRALPHAGWTRRNPGR
jgi:Homocysteine/selenocysteine methylase (S-methylmethionine-dependent)